MSEVSRLYKYRSLFASRRLLTVATLVTELEISRATLKRDLAKLRDQLHVPIVYDRDLGAYRLEQAADDSELPGLWFSQDEILALLTMQQMLAQLEPGLLGERLKPLQGRLTELMEKFGLSGKDIARCIRIVHAGKRRVKASNFEAVAAATLARKRLRIHHYNRQSGVTVEREVSPLRLVHYRDNWYLDAWCHLRDDLRNFSIDAIARLQVLEASAREVPVRSLDEALGSGYGIFGGTPRNRAVLRFTRERARWVEREIWHPLQESRTEPDGSYLLSVPYSDDRELVGDIMRFGADVQVLEPRELRSKVHRALLEAVGRYV